MDEQSFTNQSAVSPQPLPTFAPPSTPSHKKWFIIGGAAVVLIIAGIAAYLLFSSGGDSGVSFNITTPDQIQSGVPFPLTVSLSNDSNVLLKDAQIIISLPNNFVFVGPGKKTFENKNAGNIPVSGIVKEDFQVIALGNENTVSQVSADFSYVPGTFHSRFEKIVTHDMVVGSAGVSLDIIPPSSVFANDTFETEISYKNNATIDLKNAQLRVLYPIGFQFTSSNPNPDPSEAAQNLWPLGDLAPGAQGSIKLKGSLIGQSGAAFDFKLDLTADIGDGPYTVAEKSTSVTIASSPLSLSMTVNDDPAHIFSPGDTLRYKITYANNTEVALNDVVITAKLVGDMYDLNSLDTKGALRSADNAVVWNASRVAGLKTLASGASGSVTFEVNAKSQYPITRLSSKNFTLHVDGEISSPTVPRSISASQTMAKAVLENKVRGKLAVNATAYYRDAASGILNKGSVPPQVGVPTQYTLHWLLKNYSTDVDTVVVKAFLGGNVTFTGQAKSTTGVLPVYDDRTQEVSWTIDKVPATRGILSPAYEATFQVELTPAINQRGQFATLIQQSQASYHDTFTNETLAAQDSEITTQLPDDPTIKESERTVK